MVAVCPTACNEAALNMREYPPLGFRSGHQVERMLAKCLQCRESVTISSNQ
jgi:hypothetical protein